MATPPLGSWAGAYLFHTDGYDTPVMPRAHEIIHNYDIPAGGRRRDGIPVPLDQVDARFLAYFKLGSAGKQAAASAYKVAAWAQDLSNAALSLYYERDDSSAAEPADRHAGAAIGARELVANTIAHYNYLEYHQRHPIGVELYNTAEAVPHSTCRGRKGRAWLSTVARDEFIINVKVAAEACVNRRRGRKGNAGLPGGGLSGTGSGSGGSGSSGGRGKGGGGASAIGREAGVKAARKAVEAAARRAEEVAQSR